MLKIGVIFLSILSTLTWHINKIKKSNELSIKASDYYNQQNYAKALSCYYDLAKTYRIKEEELQLNLAHCYFKLGAIEVAQKTYISLLSSEVIKIKSTAFTQLANLEALKGNKNKALKYLKKALIENPDNSIARFNYELISTQNPKKKPRDPQKKTKVSDKNTDGEEASKETNDPNGSEGEDISEDIDQENISANNSNNSNNSLGNDQNIDAAKWKTQHKVPESSSIQNTELVLKSLQQQEINFLMQHQLAPAKQNKPIGPIER